jgi:UDP-glucose 4-epimerase
MRSSQKYAHRLESKDVEDIDTVFHFGSPCSVVEFKDRPAESMENTLSGFIRVMELAKEHGFNVVYPSSGNIYASVSGDGASKETQAGSPNNLYAVSKITEENIAAYYKNSFGVVSTGLRIFAGYGMGEERKGKLASVVTHFAKSILNGEKVVLWGSGKQRRDFVFINDIVLLAVKSATNQKAPILNVGSGVSYSYNEVIKLIAEESGIENPKVEHIGKPNDYVENTRADISLAAKLYKFKPTPLKKGLKEYVRYLGKMP